MNDDLNWKGKEVKEVFSIFKCSTLDKVYCASEFKCMNYINHSF